MASCSDDRTIKLWSSNLSRIVRLPIEQITQRHQKLITETLASYQENNIQEKNWLEFLQELIHFNRRFDVDVADTDLSINSDEFDIEIER